VFLRDYKRRTKTKYQPFTDLSHFGLELVSLEEYQEDRLVDVGSLCVTTVSTESDTRRPTD